MISGYGLLGFGTQAGTADVYPRETHLFIYMQPTAITEVNEVRESYSIRSLSQGDAYVANGFVTQTY